MSKVGYIECANRVFDAGALTFAERYQQLNAGGNKKFHHSPTAKAVAYATNVRKKHTRPIGEESET